MRVGAATLGALTFSYAGVMDFLRLLALVASIVYSVVKTLEAVEARKRRRDES